MHVSTGIFAKRDAAADGKGKDQYPAGGRNYGALPRCKRHKAGSAVPACNVMRASGKRDCRTAQSGCGSCSGTNYNLPGARDGRARCDGKGAKKLCGLQRSSVRAAHMRDGPGIKRCGICDGNGCKCNFWRVGKVCAPRQRSAGVWLPGAAAFFCKQGGLDWCAERIPCRADGA